MLRTMGSHGAAWAVVLTAVAAGCGSTEDGGVAADCSSQIRVDDTVYTSYGFTDRHGTTYESADQASCEDVGEDARGSVFTDEPPQVATWTFRGYPSDEVLGVRFDADSFEVYVADSVAPADRERIYEELAR